VLIRLDIFCGDTETAQAPPARIVHGCGRTPHAMDLSYYRDSLKRYGVLPTFAHAAFRIANRVSHIVVLRAIVVTPHRLPPKLTELGQGPGRMLSAEAMRPFVADPLARLSHPFIDAAMARGDRCYAIFDGDVLAAYGWYATRPTRLFEIDDGLSLRFDPSYTYMYWGYTRPSHRGQRMHAVGMASALALVTREGQKGLLSYVDATNYASLRSCERTGFAAFGTVALAKAGDRYFCRASSGCKPYGFEVVQDRGSSSTLRA
jgi:hypothetical protein